MARGSRVIREAVTTRTIEPMLRRADTDADGITSRAELLQLLRIYDADGNGRLSHAERARAMGELASVVADTRTNTVGLDVPRPKPTAPAPAPAPKPPVVVAPPVAKPPVVVKPAPAPARDAPPAPGGSWPASTVPVPAPAS